MTTSLSSALERLANYRVNNTRASQEIFEQGCVILKASPSARLGDDGWAFLEQLALAAIDVGRLDIADECLKQLGAKFPNSPRVDVLTGIRMEASVSNETILQYYDEVLEEDPTNAAIWKRYISVLRRSGRIDAAVEELSRFLDTFYTDAEGWLELADIYTSCNKYTHALEALSHAMILSPQNPFTALQFAETAYTAGDVSLALRMFLNVVEMGERDLTIDEPPTGINIRAWLGVKHCARQLVAAPHNATSSGTAVPPPKKLKLIEELATERVLAAYKGQKESGIGYVSAWLGSGHPRFIRSFALKLPKAMRNPVKRLSLALGFNDAKPTGASGWTLPPPDRNELAQFLSSSKERYLKDINSTPSKGHEWTVVMGNEAGDLDTVASSIAYAWLQSEVHKKPTIPLLQLEREDLNLRAENTYALSLAGITQPKEQLLFLTDLGFSITAPKAPFPSNTFALVDHNSLGDAYTFENPRAIVTAILDHHADEKHHLSASPRTITSAGSCTSLVTALFPPDMPPTLATLLLTGILIDTNALKPGGKALEPDHSAAGFLAPRSTLAPFLPADLLTALHADPLSDQEELCDASAIQSLTKKLKDLKESVGHLSARDLLRRDYKEYTLDVPGAGAVRAGLASVPVRLRDWDLPEAAGAWMKEREIQVLGVLTSFKGGKTGKGKNKREMAWVVHDSRAKEADIDVKPLAKKLWKGLEASDKLRVKLKKKKYDMEKGGKLPHGAKSRSYDQGDAEANRKVTAPLMKTVLEAPTSKAAEDITQ
ncbi:hypothetical protein H0H92_009860 [Tricholoma furcatifolium]|nr:hypothetical protein H0H92_009860 [Tricholoma furcatifolium]